MQEHNGAGGLCMTCNNVPTCFHHARRGPALFCELFDDYVAPAERYSSPPPPPLEDASVALGTAEDAPDRYTGLCVNCLHRATCTHPRPTGGVWHCEDYD